MAEEGLNAVQLLGRLCADPELRFTPSNQGVLSLRMACTKTWFDATAKERKEKTEYINCVIWGKRGESLHKILAKGSRIHVTGELTTRSWEDKKHGDKRYATEVVVSNVILLGGKGQHDGASNAPGGTMDYPEPHDAPDDDDIPF